MHADLLASAAARWAPSGSLESFHHAFRYADVAAVAAAAAVAGLLVVHHRRPRPLVA